MYYGFRGVLFDLVDLFHSAFEVIDHLFRFIDYGIELIGFKYRINRINKKCKQWSNKKRATIILTAAEVNCLARVLYNYNNRKIIKPHSKEEFIVTTIKQYTKEMPNSKLNFVLDLV